MMNTFISSSAMMVRSNRHKIVSANEIPNEAPPLRTISPDLALDIIQKNINSLFEAVQSSTEKRSIDAIKTAAQALERQLNQILDTNPGLLHPDDLQLLQDIMEIIKKNPMTSDQNKNFQNFDMISTLFEKRATEISFSQEQIKTNRYAQFLALSATVLSKIQILSLGSLAGSSLWDTWSAIGYAELFTELSPMRWDGQNYNYNAYVMNPDFGKGNPLPELKENSKPACMTGVTGVDKGPNELNATYSVVGGDRPAHKWHTRLQTLFPWTKLASNSDSSNGHQARTWDLVLQEQHIQAKRDYIIETILKSSDGKGQFKYGLNERSAREMALALAKGDFTFVPMSTIINSLQETGVGTRKSQFLWKILGEKGGERVVLWSLESVLKNALDEGRFDKTLFNRLRENLASLRSSSDMSSAMDSTQYEKLLNDFLSRNAVSDEETRNSIINNFYTGNSNDKTKYTADKSNLKLMDRWYNFIRDQAIDNGYDSDGNNRSNAAAKMIIDEARRLSLLQKIADSPTKDDLSRAYSISESMAEEILAAIPNNIDQIGSDVAGHYSTVTRDINGNANHEDVLTQFHLRLAGMMTIVYEIKDGRDQREANYLRVMKKIVNNTKSPLIPFFKNAGLSTLKQNADGIYKCNGNMEESFRVLLESRFMKTHLGFSTPQAEFIVSAIIDQIADCQVEFLEDWVNKVEHELNAHPEFSLNQAIEAHQNNLQALVGIKIDEILRKGGPVHSALAKKFKYNNFDDPITYQLVVDGTKDIANSLLAEDMFENVNAHANGLGQEVMQNARWAKETLGLMENNPKIYSFQTAFATLRTQRETTTNLSETTFGEDGKSFIKLLDKLSKILVGNRFAKTDIIAYSQLQTVLINLILGKKDVTVYAKNGTDISPNELQQYTLLRYADVAADIEPFLNHIFNKDRGAFAKFALTDLLKIKNHKTLADAIEQLNRNDQHPLIADFKGTLPLLASKLRSAADDEVQDIFLASKFADFVKKNNPELFSVLSNINDQHQLSTYLEALSQDIHNETVRAYNKEINTELLQLAENLRPNVKADKTGQVRFKQSDFYRYLTEASDSDTDPEAFFANVGNVIKQFTEHIAEKEEYRVALLEEINATVNPKIKEAHTDLSILPGRILDSITDNMIAQMETMNPKNRFTFNTSDNNISSIVRKTIDGENTLGNFLGTNANAAPESVRALVYGIFDNMVTSFLNNESAYIHNSPEWFEAEIIRHRSDNRYGWNKDKGENTNTIALGRTVSEKLATLSHYIVHMLKEQTTEAFAYVPQHLLEGFRLNLAASGFSLDKDVNRTFDISQGIGLTAQIINRNLMSDIGRLITPSNAITTIDSIVEKLINHYANEEKIYRDSIGDNSPVSLESEKSREQLSGVLKKQAYWIAFGQLGWQLEFNMHTLIAKLQAENRSDKEIDQALKDLVNKFIENMPPSLATRGLQRDIQLLGNQTRRAFRRRIESYDDRYRDVSPQARSNIYFERNVHFRTKQLIPQGPRTAEDLSVFLASSMGLSETGTENGYVFNVLQPFLEFGKQLDAAIETNQGALDIDDLTKILEKNHSAAHPNAIKKNDQTWQNLLDKDRYPISLLIEGGFMFLVNYDLDGRSLKDIMNSKALAAFNLCRPVFEVPRLIDSLNQLIDSSGIDRENIDRLIEILEAAANSRNKGHIPREQYTEINSLIESINEQLPDREQQEFEKIYARHFGKESYLNREIGVLQFGQFLEGQDDKIVSWQGLTDVMFSKGIMSVTKNVTLGGCFNVMTVQAAIEGSREQSTPILDSITTLTTTQTFGYFLDFFFKEGAVKDQWSDPGTDKLGASRYKIGKMISKFSDMMLRIGLKTGSSAILMGIYQYRRVWYSLYLGSQAMQSIFGSNPDTLYNILTHSGVGIATGALTMAFIAKTLYQKRLKGSFIGPSSISMLLAPLGISIAGISTHLLGLGDYFWIGTLIGYTAPQLGIHTRQTWESFKHMALSWLKIPAAMASRYPWSNRYVLPWTTATHDFFVKNKPLQLTKGVPVIGGPKQ